MPDQVSRHEEGSLIFTLNPLIHHTSVKNSGHEVVTDSFNLQCKNVATCDQYRTIIEQQTESGKLDSPYSGPSQRGLWGCDAPQKKASIIIIIMIITKIFTEEGLSHSKVLFMRVL